MVIGRKSLKILHWNLGARKWCNKLIEIENLLNEHKPDLCYISEANLWEGLEPHDRELPGHHLVYSNTMDTLKHARLMLIVKDGVDTLKLNQFMDEDTAVIWVKIGSGRTNCVRVGGIYRQHQILGQNDRDSTRLEIQQEQEER